MANTKIPSELIDDNISLGGSPTTTTQTAGDNSTKIATTAYVETAVSNLVDSAPDTLNTLNEIAAAINDNATFYDTVVVKTGSTMTGNLVINADLTVDTNTLYVDSTNNRVGIGDSSPATKLEILDANGIGLRFGDVAATPSSQTAGYIGMSTSAYSGNNGDLVLIPRTSSASRILLMEGNVGIGTTSPSTNLSIFNPSATWNQYATLRLATETEGTYYGEVSFHRGTSNDTDRGLVFNLGGTERMRILNTGNVGIGATSAFDNKLEVNGGDIRVRGTSTPSIKFNNGDQEVVGIRLKSGASGVLSFHTDKMVIDTSGNIGLGTTSPKNLSGQNSLTINGSVARVDFKIADTFRHAIVTESEYLALTIDPDNTQANSRLAVLVDNTERMRIDSSGILIVNNGFNSTGGIVNGYRSAITVGTSATNISNASTYGGLAFVWVNSGGNIAHDLVSYSLSDVDVIASQNISGSPAGRTYSAASGILKVAMASGSYSVYATEIRIATS